MSYFPMSIDLTGKTVFLIGGGAQIRTKAEKLAPFGAELIRQDTFSRADAERGPAMVIVGDTDLGEAEKIHELCCLYRIPVNVVDVPRLCSFYFPALVTRGDLTVSVSTGGNSPGTAAYLRQRVEEMLPEETEAILEWAARNREEFRRRNIQKRAIAGAFAKGRPLTEAEIRRLVPVFD